MNVNEKDFPKEIKKTIFVSLCTANSVSCFVGDINISEINYEALYANSDTDTYKVIGSADVVIPIEFNRDDFNNQQIDGLEKLKDKELADHYMRMKDFQDRIDSLLAIEHQPEEES